jgi:hypothetical protein
LRGIISKLVWFGNPRAGQDESKEGSQTINIKKTLINNHTKFIFS